MAKTILITGGTGFLGRHLARALKDQWEIVIAGRNNKQAFLAEKSTGVKSVPLDVARIESVRDVFHQVKPEVVIHAAATKFVDLSERQPMECTDINVVGSQNVARVAVDHGVSAVIGISTDKAAPPVRNIYGLSKALMERMYCAMDGQNGTRFMCVRYGNVVWSTGSVFPIWRKMHAEDGVLRSTGPEMTRFFFQIEEAVRLVTTALDGIDDLHGKVLSRSMKAARISDILDAWVGTQGGRWEKIAGRPGDKPYECLIGELELEYTSRLELGGTPHYLISFNRPAETPLRQVVSSDNAEKLTRDEIIAMINDFPREELT